MRRFFKAVAEEVIPGQGGDRVYRTVYTLFRFPGKLTADYIAGRRKPYMTPVQVYLTVSLIFFLLGTGYFQYNLAEYDYITGYGDTEALFDMAKGEASRVGIGIEEYREHFDERLASQKKVMMAVLIPIFAVGMLPLFRRRKYGEHLIFSIHFFAALLLFMVIVIPMVLYGLIFLARGLVSIWPQSRNAIQGFTGSEMSLALFIYIPMGIYVTKALGRVYDGGRRAHILRAVLLIIWQGILVVVGFRTALFFTTYYSLKWFGLK